MVILSHSCINISNDSYISISMHQHFTTHSKVSICSLKIICPIKLIEQIELIELIQQVELIQQIELTLVVNLGKPRFRSTFRAKYFGSSFVNLSDS